MKIPCILHLSAQRYVAPRAALEGRRPIVKPLWPWAPQHLIGGFKRLKTTCWIIPSRLGWSESHFGPCFVTKMAHLQSFWDLREPKWSLNAQSWRKFF